MTRLTEFADWTYFYFVRDEEFVISEKDASKLASPEAAQALAAALDALSRCEAWDREEIERALRGVVEETGMKAKQVFQPIRVAVTGSSVSPPLFESIALLGRERTLARIKAALRERR